MDSNTPNDGRQFIGTPNECGNSEGLELIRKSLKKIQIDEEKRQGKMAGGEPSHIFVIFGASGDLAKKKIYPTLWALYKNNLLPGGSRLVGYSRSKISVDDIRAKCKPWFKVCRQVYITTNNKIVTKMSA